jgi:hypothetical protein
MIRIIFQTEGVWNDSNGMPEANWPSPVYFRFPDETENIHSVFSYGLISTNQLIQLN